MSLIGILFGVAFVTLLAKAILETIWGSILILHGFACHLLAANRKMSEREYVDWVSAKVWGERAERLASHVTKGTKLLVVVLPEERAYKAKLVVHATEIEFLSAKVKHDYGDEPTSHAAEEPELPLATVAA